LRFRDRRLEFHLLLLVLFNVLLLSVQSQADLWVRGFSAVLSPPVRLLHGTLDSMAGFFSRLDTLRKAESQNRELSHRLFWTRLANDRLRLENLYLSQIQAGREQPILEPGPHIEASIIRRKMTSYFSELLIDAGYLKGARTRQAALTPQGLLGIVDEVSATTATVRPILHPDSVVSIVDLRSGTHAVAKGDGTGFLELKYLPPYADVAPGDEFVTDCWDVQYFPGLRVGVVMEAVPEEGQMRVRLRPWVDPAAQTWLVLVPEVS
jgi:rod shape-determining protein MreC